MLKYNYAYVHIYINIHLLLLGTMATVNDLIFVMQMIQMNRQMNILKICYLHYNNKYFFFGIGIIIYE